MGLHHLNYGGVLINTQHLTDNDRKIVEEVLMSEQRQNTYENEPLCFCGKLNKDCDNKSHKEWSV